jgi:hypothetical protein
VNAPLSPGFPHVDDEAEPVEVAVALSGIDELLPEVVARADDAVADGFTELVTEVADEVMLIAEELRPVSIEETAELSPVGDMVDELPDRIALVKDIGGMGDAIVEVDVPTVVWFAGEDVNEGIGSAVEVKDPGPVWLGIETDEFPNDDVGMEKELGPDDSDPELIWLELSEEVGVLPDPL